MLTFPQFLTRGLRIRAVTALSALLVLVLAVPATADIERTSGDGLVPVLRWAGENRYDTAQLIATEGPADAPMFSSDTVVVARGDAFPDGLAGSFLAGQHGAPVLLTDSDELPAETAAALDELAPTRVIILGGEGAISAGVADELGEGRTVERHGGSDRYETAVDVAVAGSNSGTIGEIDGMPTAILATGQRGADALVSGPLAAAEGFPLLLTRTDGLPEATASTLTDLGIEHVLIMGGEAAVSASVADAVTDLGITFERLSGDNREQTALAAAEYARDELGWPLDEVHVAGAADRAFADALALGPRAGLSQAPILLVGEAGPSGPVRAALSGLDAVALVGVAGGDAAVSSRAVTQFRTGLAVQASQLAFPRGVETGPDDAIYVAEAGFGGDDCIGEGEEELCFGPTSAVTRVADGTQTRAYDELPSSSFGGVADVAFAADGTVAAPIGWGTSAEFRAQVAEDIPLASQFGTLATITEEGVEVLADLAAFEAANNPDETPPSEDEFESPFNSNPFAVARDDSAGVWVVADAGGNTLLEVTDTGEVSLITVFPDVDTPEGPRQYVPTSVVVGPDGAYYVGGLAGETPQAVTIYRVDPDNGDLTAHAEGFTFVLDIGFDDAGNLYVLQAVPTEPDFAGPDPGPGTVIRVTPEGERTEIGGGGLVFPLGLEVAPDGLYVSHCPFCPTGGELLQLTIPE